MVSILTKKEKSKTGRDTGTSGNNQNGTPDCNGKAGGIKGVTNMGKR
jgi:hypothetical protein